MSEETKEAAPEAVSEAVEAAPAPSLTIQDLANLRNIIDVASQRGAFKANEFATVGDAYTKLDTFLASVPQQAEAPAVPAEATQGGVAEAGE